MCGIVGMAGDLDFSDRQAFRDFLEVCQLRGRDSTGVISVNKQLAYGTYKNLGPPAFMFDRKSYAETIEQGSHAAFIGHCRHKTIGGATIDNAHPFDFEEKGIVGVHNGTLTNYYSLDGYKTGMVDSEALYSDLATNGPEETFAKLHGAWACVWWDDQDETLNFIRNDQRPMWFTWSEDRRKMFWASETWMFGAIERKQKLWKGPKDDYVGKYIELPTDVLWSFKIEPHAKKGDATIKMQPAKPISRAAPKVYASGNGHTGRYTNSWSSSGSPSSGGSVPHPFEKLDDQLPVHLRPKPDTLALIQGGKSSTTDSTPNSTTPSKSGSESEKQSKPTTSGEQSTDSPDQQSSTQSRKTNRKKLTVKLNGQPINNLASSSNHVSFRSIVGMAFVTDEKTGCEYSEHELQNNTGGICSYCDEPIGDLTEIYEFFGKERFLCTHCAEPNVRIA